MIKELQDRYYHDIEQILNDFKNGNTYSDSIENVNKIVSETALAVCEEIEKKMSVNLPPSIREVVNEIKQEIKDNEPSGQIK